VPFAGQWRTKTHPPRGPNVRGLISVLFSNHNRFGQQPNEVASYERSGPHEPHTPHVGAVSAHAGLSCLFGWAAPRRGSPPGALAAAGFYVLFFNHNRFGRPPRKNASYKRKGTSRASHASRGSCECPNRALVPFCWAVPRRDSPPGALAAMGFSALFLTTIASGSSLM